MRLKVKKISAGLHPSEVVVEINNGAERLVVASRALKDNTIDVGAPLARKSAGDLLIELPREAMSGRSRIWVKKADLVEDTEQVRAA